MITLQHLNLKYIDLKRKVDYLLYISSQGGGGGSTSAATLTGTTIASNVVNSSLTSVGTITSGVWQGTPISSVYLTIPGIDDVLAVGQTFTADRSIDLNGNKLTLQDGDVYLNAMKTLSVGVDGSGDFINIGESIGSGGPAIRLQAIDAPGYIDIDAPLAVIDIGDVTQVGNGTHIQVIDGTQEVLITGTSLDFQVQADGVAFRVKGDGGGGDFVRANTNLFEVVNGANNTAFTVNATTEVINVKGQSQLNLLTADESAKINLTPTLITYTADTHTFNGVVNMVEGIIGTNTNDAPAAGNIGQEINSTISTYTNYTTTATYQNVTSITLTAGDWDIDAFMTYSSNSATITAASNAIFVISTTTASAAGSTEGLNISYVPQAALLGTSRFSEGIPPYRVSISGTTTYYLNTQATFTLGNPQYVGSIRARRMR